MSAGLVNNGSSRAPGKGSVTSGRAAARVKGASASSVSLLPQQQLTRSAGSGQGQQVRTEGAPMRVEQGALREQGAGSRDSDGLAPASVSAMWDS